MAARIAGFGVLLVTALLVAGCGGGYVSPHGAGLPTATVHGTETAVPLATPTPVVNLDDGTGGASVSSPSTTPVPVDPTPFTVRGWIDVYARDGADVFVAFAACQHAALQHAADTLDQHFDPTPLCKRSPGTTCNGAGTYARLRAGAAILVKDATGRTVTQGHLGRGRLTRELALMGPKAACAFPFTVPGVPGGGAQYAVAVPPAVTWSFDRAHAADVVVTVQD
jgi:hypothetical protein